MAASDLVTLALMIAPLIALMLLIVLDPKHVRDQLRKG